jgi:hypothetical protein
MLAFNNLCLQYVEVTFYQVARSLSIHFSILFTYIILGKKTSTAAIGACAIVFLGFVIGSYGELHFSWEGLLYGVGSSAFVALYGIFVQKSLAVVDNNQWRLLHYNTTLAIMILFPLMLLSGELSEIRENVQFFDEFGFWLLMVRKDRRCEDAKTLPGGPLNFVLICQIITAASGFGINIAMFLQVKYTSALTNTISGTAKACVQTLLAAVIFRNPISVSVSEQSSLYPFQLDLRAAYLTCHFPTEWYWYIACALWIGILWICSLHGTYDQVILICKRCPHVQHSIHAKCINFFQPITLLFYYYYQHHRIYHHNENHIYTFQKVADK